MIKLLMETGINVKDNAYILTLSDMDILLSFFLLNRHNTSRQMCSEHPLNMTQINVCYKFEMLAHFASSITSK